MSALGKRFQGSLRKERGHLPGAQRGPQVAVFFVRLKFSLDKW